MRRSLGAALAAAFAFTLAACNPTLPPEQKVGSVVYASPSWDKPTRDDYYWRQQGTVMMPVAWFKALEEPEGTQLISDRDTLSRFGFLVDDVPQGQWPIGFTPFNLQGVETLGLGCAACHTGQINYKGVGIRIDGGGGLQNSALFTSTIGKAVMVTAANSDKFDRFARRVLGDKYGAETKSQLKNAFDTAALKALNQGGYETLHGVYPVEEGFGRLDALQRIANTLLGDDLQYQANKKPATAPVRLPHIWDAPYFDWVQYNGSVRQPMIRNVGEGLGVKAQTNFVNFAGLTPPEPQRWASSIPVHDLHATEENLRKLKAPVWPKELPAVDTVLAYTKGKPLYDELCAGCHAPRPFSRKDWPGVTFLQVPVIDVAHVGTDSTLLTNFNTRTYDASSLGIKEPITAGQGLFAVTQQIKDFQYQHGAKPVPQEKWAEYDGYGWPNEVRGTCGYKARPLDGIWANPPFLHNGSVPSVYDLLLPVEERPRVFWVGNREYDPVKLGLIATEFPGATRIDTDTLGNSNKGHEFSNIPGAGVIGRALAKEERLAIVEYLKVLAEDPNKPTRKAEEHEGDYRYPCWEKKMYWSNAKTSG